MKTKFATPKAEKKVPEKAKKVAAKGVEQEKEKEEAFYPMAKSLVQVVGQLAW